MSATSPNPTNPITYMHTTPRHVRKQKSSPLSPQAQFYKAFGRPMAKVFLLAVFTYQVAYYFWVRLEQDEIRAEMRGTQNPPLPTHFSPYVQIHPP
ncbi:hypothetical protein K445DRAFT_316376 [Daldinia sp. EC12]|nr:hypothetical protein K445DRAFT_316376 [Daldinia sp. EC12]